MGVLQDFLRLNMCRIFDRQPSDWRDLQEMVAQLFRELGCEVTVGGRAELVRGSKEIDVDVLDSASVPPARYLCECKYWQKSVSLETVHSFRTVIQDCGANRGYIVSMAGFQSGAHKAATKTNVELVTFARLQDIFYERWVRAMGEHYRSWGDRLFPYWDYPGKKPSKPWSRNDANKVHVAYDAFHPITAFGPLFEEQGCQWKLPMTLPILDEAGNVSGSLELRTYREVYDFVEANKERALTYFQRLYGEIE